MCTAMTDVLTLSNVFESFGNGTENETQSRMCLSTERTVSTEPTQSNNCATRNALYNKQQCIIHDLFNSFNQLRKASKKT